MAENFFTGLTMRPATVNTNTSVEVQQHVLEFFAPPKRTPAVGMGASRSMVENQKAFLYLLYALFGYRSGFFVGIDNVDNVERSHFLCDINGQKLQTFLDC